MNTRATADAGMKDHYEKQGENSWMNQQQDQPEMDHNKRFATALERVEARLNGKKISARKLTALVHEEMAKY